MEQLQLLGGVMVLMGIWGILGRELWQKHQAGSLIRVLRYESIFGFFGTLGVLVGIEHLIEWLSLASAAREQWVIGVTALVTSCGVFLVGLSQLEIRAKGLWYRGTVILWSEIVSSRWEYARAGVLLVVKFRTPQRGYSSLCLRLAARDKNLVEEQLKHHCCSQIALPNHRVSVRA